MSLRHLLVIPFVCLTSVSAADVQFNRDVRPILSNHCFTCHGPDATTREGALRLDQRESATKPAESGEIAIRPGDVDHSELIRRITSSDADEKMPPAGGKPLTADQISILKQWIASEAKYESHWAFVAPTKPGNPTIHKRDASWVKNEIDRFVVARLDRESLRPSQEASRETLIRRVSFGLTGLPPTLKEIDAFLAEKSPKAFENMVDGYLKSDAYGEHMARHWLDLARYADTNGYQYDTERTQWVWRDWVINAYNRNMPFDEFTIEQLAGDLLPNATPQQRLATGFNRNHGITIEGGIIDEEYRTEYVMDRLVTTGSVWMGLTIGCARCHEHKFDPISQKEFYELYSFFNQVPERGMRGFAPQERIPSPLAAAQQQDLDAEIAKLKAELAEPANVTAELNKWSKQIATSKSSGWTVLSPTEMKSSGGSTLTKLEDNSVLVGGANPQKDIYDIVAPTTSGKITAVRMEALTHPSLPGGGPGRHTNSNFVLSEFEVTAVSVKDSSKQMPVKFARAIAEYSQSNYEIGKTIDGTTASNNGWAVDGPTRKLPVTAMFIAEQPFGFEGGTELHFRLRHEASFATHGVGRPRFSVTGDPANTLQLKGVPGDILRIAKWPAEKRSAADADKLKSYFLEHHDPRVALKQRIATLEKGQAEGFPQTMIMQDLAKHRDTFVLDRGQYNKPTEKVSTGVPSLFPAMPKSAPKNRLGFSQWLVDPSHPLTARVAVNRYWQRLFGVGLVKTVEDFGLQGEMPSHPELLDWLATEFIRSGWDVKHMQRLIVTSATFRQSSHVTPEAHERNPENRLLARGPRLRMDAEEVRDAALAASGLLVRTLGGKSVYPYQPKGLWMELNNRPGYSKAYPQGSGDDLYRRSMYTFWKRTVPSPMLKTLDAPEREFCTVQRSRTNTPTQALLLLNAPQFVEAGRHLAERMLTESGNELDDQLAYGFRLLVGRLPSQPELDVFREAFEAEREFFAKDEAAATRLLSVGDSKVNSELDTTTFAAMTSVARLIINLDEAITRE